MSSKEWAAVYYEFLFIANVLLTRVWWLLPFVAHYRRGWWSKMWFLYAWFTAWWCLGVMAAKLTP